MKRCAKNRNAMNSYRAMRSAACGALLLLFLYTTTVENRAVAASAPAKLNVLLITADDLGLQLSCYGDPIAKTPSMDALAARSVRFETAYVTQASCSPSRSSMFTGLYPHGNGHYGLANANVGFRVHEHLIENLLPNVLKRHGYRTGIIGKLHVNPESAFQFDTRQNEGFGSREIGKQVAFAREFFLAGATNGSTAVEPWFLMFNVFDPHVARKRMRDGSRGPQYFPNQVLGLPESPLNAKQVTAWPWQQIDTSAQLEKIAGYYNCVHRVDLAVGHLMQALEDAGHADDTLIILVGDHGPPFSRGKTSCYESGLRVPLIVHWPGVSQSHASDKLASSVDIYPTILDATGIDLPHGLHGRSLRGVLSTNHREELQQSDSEEDSSWRKALVGEFHFHGASPFFPRRAITDGQYKLIHNIRATEIDASNSVDGDKAYQFAQDLPPGHPARLAMQRLANPPEWELYNLVEDPSEFFNLAGTPEAKTIQLILSFKLREWQLETDDPFTSEDFRRKTEAKYKATP